MTNPRSFAGSDWWNPAAGVEAAVRWNLMTVEWMTRGWRQWSELALALADNVAPDAVVAANARPRAGARVQPTEHAVAKAAPKRPARKRPARPRA